MSDKLLIVSLDPGVTTGHVAALLSDTEVTLTPGQEKFNEFELYLWLHRIRPSIVICEDFEYRSRARDDLELFSRNLIGVVNLYVQERNAITREENCLLYMQKPSTGEGAYFKGDRALSELGIYLPQKRYHHAMSAMRHLMYWLNFGAGYQYNKKQQLKMMIPDDDQESAPSE